MSYVKNEVHDIRSDFPDFEAIKKEFLEREAEKADEDDLNGSSNFNSAFGLNQNAKSSKNLRNNKKRENRENFENFQQQSPVSFLQLAMKITAKEQSVTPKARAAPAENLDEATTRLIEQFIKQMRVIDDVMYTCFECNF
jgi:hypothetical protein